MLGNIAYAFWRAGTGAGISDFACHDDTYVEDIAQGETLAISFGTEGAVAVFFSSDSERNPYPKGSPPYNQDHYFRGMPARLFRLKARSLESMPAADLQGFGGPHAGITSAMWADGDRFSAAESRHAVYDNSLWTPRDYLLPLEPALREWQIYLSLSDAQVAAVRALYPRRLAATDETITLDPAELAVLQTRAEEVDAEPDDDTPLLADPTEARAMLRYAGVTL